MANTIDHITYDEALSAVQQSGLNDDNASELSRLITAVSQLIDERFGAMVSRTVTAEVHSGGAKRALRLLVTPASAITSVAEDGTTVAATGYTLDTSTGLLWRDLGCWSDLDPANVSVTYTAGRYASTAVVDAQVKMASELTLKHVWSQFKGLASPTFGALAEDGGARWPAPFVIPRAAAELLGGKALFGFA